jgi:hypothetical protein
VTALAMGRPGVAAIALAGAAALAFAAHEPILVLAGQRGSRARREESARAGRVLAALGTGAVGLGAVGLGLAPADARWSALVPIALTGLLAPFIARKAEKTATGEILAAAALSSAAIPVALAAGAPAALAWGAWAAFCLAFGASTLAVRTVVAHARAPVAWAHRTAAPALALAVAVGLGFSGVLTPAASLGAAPMLALALAVAAAPPRPAALRRVGWALVAASAVLSVTLALGAHLPAASG